MKTYFKAGTEHQIYQRPMSQQEPEDRAKLVRCVRPFTEFDWPGLIVEEWMVQFLGEQESYLRIVAVPKNQKQ